MWKSVVIYRVIKLLSAILIVFATKYWHPLMPLILSHPIHGILIAPSLIAVAHALIIGSPTLGRRVRGRGRGVFSPWHITILSINPCVSFSCMVNNHYLVVIKCQKGAGVWVTNAWLCVFYVNSLHLLLEEGVGHGFTLW